MPRHISRNFVFSNCHVGSHREHYNGFTSNTSYTRDANLSSAVQIGLRLAVIGDEFHRNHERQNHGKIGHFVLASMRVAHNCQAFVLSILRSIKQTVCRVDHGESQVADNLPLMIATEPESTCRKLLLTLALITVSGLLITLACED